MRKLRMLALVLCAVLLLSGCSALLEREYSAVEPHSRKYWESDTAGVLRAEDYQELVNDILTLVAAHTEESTIRIYMPEQTLLETEELLEQACREVQQETAAGAYLVEYLSYTLSEAAACREAALHISYRRTAEQYADVVSVTSVTSAAAMEELIRGAAETGRQELVLRVHYFTADAEEIRALVRTLDQDYSGDQAGEWSVEFYPASGERRIVEFLLPKNP